MKTLKKFIVLIVALSATYLAYSQPPEEFLNPTVDNFWIAIDYDNQIVPDSSGGSSDPDEGEDLLWNYYIQPPDTPWYNIWFYDDPFDASRMKRIRMGFWIKPLIPGIAGQLFFVVNWSTPDWDPAVPGYPKPMNENFIMRSPINGPIVVPPIPPGGPPLQWIEMVYEIPQYNPEWVSVDIFGPNIIVSRIIKPPPPNSPLLPWWNGHPGGTIVHECLPGGGGIEFDYGDAPEGDTAYIDPLVIGSYPTCVQVGPLNSFIKHGFPNPLFFGGYIDGELDGNAGWCPAFGPNHYNMDECGTFPYPIPPNNPVNPVDEGLMMPVPQTIGLLQPAFYGYFTCGAVEKQAMDTVCNFAQWGQDIDIWIDASQSFGGFFNILFDWNQDGDWNDIVECQGSPVPEHALVNWPVPQGYFGPASAMPPPLPPIQVGPKGGYVWARFTLTERPVQLPWDGSGVFADGETEDYLLYIAPRTKVIPLSNWSMILAIGLIVLFTIFVWWRRR
jgi:hypothetical protein